MEYNELVKEAREEVPEFNKEYLKQVNDGILDKDSGVHIVFSYAFVPLAIKAISSGNKDLQKRIFSFVEKMAESKDKSISEVCDFTVMEQLHDEIPDATLKPLLGEESLMSLSAVSGYMR